jgi:hypothetical protein
MSVKLSVRSVLGSVGVLAGLAVLFGACGARDEIPVPPPPPPLPDCLVDADCEGFDDLCRNVRCVVEEDAGAGGFGGGDEQGLTLPNASCREVNPVDCDDGDICTIDTCAPVDGSCSYAPATLDSDGDGFNGPREGTVAGDPDSCGDDCDDTNENAFPGNPEVCDGADNDCNGVIDDNATFVPIDGDAVQISENDQTPAGAGGISWSGTSYVATYTGTSAGFDIWRSQLAPDGQKLQADELLKVSNSDGFGGPLIWTGDRYGVAWQERRDGDYEVYFRLLNESGSTVEVPPVQLSDAFGFSINVDLGWTGTRFVAVWQDERNGQFNLFGRTISVEGVPLSNEVQLVPDSSFPDEAPSVAASSDGIGVAWGHGNAQAHFIQFQTFDFDLNPVSPVVTFNDGLTDAVYPTVVWNDGNYIVAWFDRSASPAGIYASVVDPAGNVVVAPTAISSTPNGSFSRYPTLKALGDRVLVLFSDDRDGNQGYELYGRMVSDLLVPLTEPTRITQASGDSINPRAAFGPDGNVGILFRDDRLGAQHVFFTRLGCLVGN